MNAERNSRGLFGVLTAVTEEYHLLELDAMVCGRNLPIFRRNCYGGDIFLRNAGNDVISELKLMFIILGSMSASDWMG